MKLILTSGETIAASPHFSLLDNLKNGGIHIMARVAAATVSVAGAKLL